MAQNPNSLANLQRGIELNREECRERKELFLAAFKETWPNITEAAKAANVPRKLAYTWKTNDKAFAEAWQAIQDSHLDALEKELLADSRQRGGAYLKIPVLKAMRPDVWGDRSKVQHEGSLAWEIVSAVPRPGLRDDAEQPGEVVN